MLEHAAQIVRGQRVALVGNSERILKQKPAAVIDAADVVIRINRGLPRQCLPEKVVGARTTIWATAKYWRDVRPPQDSILLLWMKLTALGAKHLKMMRQSTQATGPRIEEWPPEYERECREFVGADPSTGIRLLWWMRKKASVQSVSVYGMDCWEVPSHWSGKKNTPNHSPGLEYRAMMSLL